MNNRQYLDANKLARVRRQILRDKRLTDTEISQIEETAKNMIPERNVEPLLIMENFDNEEIEQMINKIRKGEKIIQQEKQTGKIEQENYKLETEIKETKKKFLRKIYQIKYMKTEQREKPCKIRSHKKEKILINRDKIATKEIPCECEETLVHKVICAGAYVVTEKLKEKPKKFTNRRINIKPRWKERIEKEINEL